MEVGSELVRSGKRKVPSGKWKVRSMNNIK